MNNPDEEEGCRIRLWPAPWGVEAWLPSLQLFTKRRLVGCLAVVTVTILMLLFQCIELHRHHQCCRAEPEEHINADLVYRQHIRYRHTKRRLPSCLIIGVRKGGTRALLEFLNLHPSIQAEKREMHFFDNDNNFALGLDWYRKQMPFSFADQITIEKTPAYFVSEKAPERIYAMNASVRLILVIREPTQRAISDYMQIHSNRLMKNKPHESFEELVINEETGDVRKSYNAVRRSMYHKHMERWLKWFPLSNFHFVVGENLVADPLTELAKVEKFLSIEHKLTEDYFYYNKTRGFFCIHKESHEKCLARSKGRKHPKVDPIIIGKLHDFFRPHNQIFYDLINRDFGWP